MEENNQTQGGFVVHVYSPGNQIIQTQNNNYFGTVYQGKSMDQGKNGFSDEQIVQALTACVSKDKIINNKQKWAGAYWCLRWKCNYPVDIKEFCKKIDSLHLVLPEDLNCDYNNIRRFCTLSFMEYDPFGKDEVKVSTMDKTIYWWCREVAFKIAEELGKSYLPKG